MFFIKSDYIDNLKNLINVLKENDETFNGYLIEFLQSSKLINDGNKFKVADFKEWLLDNKMIAVGDKNAILTKHEIESQGLDLSKYQPINKEGMNRKLNEVLGWQLEKLTRALHKNVLRHVFKEKGTYVLNTENARINPSFRKLFGNVPEEAPTHHEEPLVKKQKTADVSQQQSETTTTHKMSIDFLITSQDTTMSPLQPNSIFHAPVAQVTTAPSKPKTPTMR